MANREFLTVQEVAKELRIDPKTVIRWINTGYLPGLRIGKYYRVPKTDYQKFLEKHRKHPPDTTPSK